MTLQNEQGAIAWFSLMSTAPQACNDYYQSVYGWERREIEVPGMGKAGVYSASGRDFGGPVELDPKYGIPSHWICYFAVDDVDAHCAKVETLGGTVCYQPFDMPGFGRSAVIEDPEGNVFHLFTPLDQEADISVVGPAMGQPCWLELMVNDLDETQRFYGALLGWQFEPHEGAEQPYVMASNAGGMVAGIMNKPPEMDMLPPAWLPYFLVEDLESGMEQGHGQRRKTHVRPGRCARYRPPGLVPGPIRGLCLFVQGCLSRPAGGASLLVGAEPCCGSEPRSRLCSRRNQSRPGVAPTGLLH